MTPVCFTISFARILSSVFAIFASTVLMTPVMASAEKQRFSVDDYFQLKRVTELVLSPDGRMIAYVVESQSLEENKVYHHVYIKETVVGASPIIVDSIQDARHITWIPGGRELAFLASRDGVLQVYSYSLSSSKISKRTNAKNPVIKYRFSPDGKSLAYITNIVTSRKKTLHDQLKNSDKGIEIDLRTTSALSFIVTSRDIAPHYQTGNRAELFLVLCGEAASLVEVEGIARDFQWSPDSKKLSITYVPERMKSTLPYPVLAPTSVGIYQIPLNEFREVVTAKLPEGDQLGESYFGGEWIPSTDKVYIKRRLDDPKDIRATLSYIDWTVYDITQSNALDVDLYTWRYLEIYAAESNSFIPSDLETFYINKTVKAVQSLFKVSASGAYTCVDFLENVSGSISQFHFSVDFKKAVFVNESLDRPQEIFFWREGDGVQRLTNFHTRLAEKLMPRVREITWKSKDGIKVNGWLLEPPLVDKNENKPWPLVTFVHGGPAFPMKNEFASYFQGWSYPMEVYALNGIAVFIPNYRGTATFGSEFAFPSRRDGPPVDDIISGIEFLIKDGVADDERLGISGHSHGAWLGPLVMTRSKLSFVAGSFSEGTTNMIARYILRSESISTNISQAFGGSVYENLDQYIDISPDLHFKNLKTTAIMFEAGAENLAYEMISSAKAARAAGINVEYIVYPDTSHVLTIPQLQAESAYRNLKWFLTWLKAKKYVTKQERTKVLSSEPEKSLP